MAGSGVSRKSASGDFLDFFGGRDSKGRKEIPTTARLIKSDTDFKKGDKIQHKVFGIGKVKKVDGDRIIVHFEGTAKEKTLMKDFAPIIKL